MNTFLTTLPLHSQRSLVEINRITPFPPPDIASRPFSTEIISQDIPVKGLNRLTRLRSRSMLLYESSSPTYLIYWTLVVTVPIILHYLPTYLGTALFDIDSRWMRQCWWNKNCTTFAWANGFSCNCSQMVISSQRHSCFTGTIRSLVHGDLEACYYF